MIFNNEEQSLSKILQITKETNKTEEKSELREESLENEQENRSFFFYMVIWIMNKFLVYLTLQNDDLYAKKSKKSFKNLKYTESRVDNLDAKFSKRLPKILKRRDRKLVFFYFMKTIASKINI